MKNILTFTITLMLAFIPQLTLANQLVFGDLIVQGSSCIGANCEAGIDLSDSTLILKEDVIRIHFDDTSTSAAFPKNDWRMVFNDADGSGNGNYFAIEDSSSGWQVFRVDSGSSGTILNIDSNGNINLPAGGTSRITNVANPVDQTDAISLGYLNSYPITQVTVPWASSTSTAMASTSGRGATAIGAGASARTWDTAVGFNSTITADGSTAIGANTRIDSQNSVAVGADAMVSSQATGSTAIGQNARVLSGATNSVALGKESIALEPNTVSVGSPGNDRRITNVSDGSNKYDAVNKRQLDQVARRSSRNMASIARNRDAALVNSVFIDQNRFYIEQMSDDMKDIFAGIAAIATIIPMTPSAPGKTTLNFGAANYRNENAIGVSVAHRVKSTIFHDALFFNCGVSLAATDVVGTASVGWMF